MPGSQLNNYDLAIEFSEDAYRRMLGAFIDAGDFLCNVLSDVTSFLHLPAVPCPHFNPTILFDVPTDVPLPPGTIDIVDVRLDLLSNSTTIGKLRFVAKVVVDHTSSSAGQIDLVKVDLSPSGLLYSHLELGPINDTNNALTHVLNHLALIPLLPVPVNRSSTSATDIVSADSRIIDDHSPSNLDGSALLLTFGGGTPGNRNGFTQSFVPVGETGAIGVNFDWLCRIIRPKLADALGVPKDAFSPPCRLNRSVSLPGDHDPKLDALELTLENGAIHVTAAVSASDTGWSATATVGGRISMSVDSGQLKITSNIDDPNIDVSLDWWVWLASAVVGAIVGGIIAGVIGAIIGAILAPLITWLAEHLLNGLINDIANRVADALRALNLNVDVSAIGLNIIFQEVHIDDVVIGARVTVTDNSPVRSMGIITVNNGQWVDLDNGCVGDSNLPGADLAWDGTRPARKIRTLCCSRMARTGHVAFDMCRFELYGLRYNRPEAIPEGEFGTLITFPQIFGIPLAPDIFIPNLLVYAVETNEQRYSVIQVMEVTKDHVKLAYKTYEKAMPRVQIVGGFDYESASTFLDPTKIVGGTHKVDAVQFKASVPTPIQTSSSARDLSPCEQRGKYGVTEPGVWTGPVVVKMSKLGTFKAVVEDFAAVKYEWLINRKKLTSNQGTLQLQTVKVTYDVKDATIKIKPDSDNAFWFELEVIVSAKDGSSISTARCVEVSGTKTVDKPHPVTWPVYQQAFTQTFGSLEVPYSTTTRGTQTVPER
ncbi:MAG TPA: hypothetical protein VLV18_09645 [Terriglobales bacterium]|nr:hypothetical protein [Terriglobales bacterium]